MKGYYTSNGYMGYVLGKGYQLFNSEDAYYEWQFKSCPDLYNHKED